MSYSFYCFYTDNISFLCYHAWGRKWFTNYYLYIKIDAHDFERKHCVFSKLYICNNLNYFHKYIIYMYILNYIIKIRSRSHQKCKIWLSSAMKNMNNAWI